MLVDNREGGVNAKHAKHLLEERYLLELFRFLCPKWQESPFHILSHNFIIASLLRFTVFAAVFIAFFFTWLFAIFWFFKLEIGKHHGSKICRTNVVGLVSTVSASDLIYMEIVLLFESQIEIFRGLISVSELLQT